MAVLVSHPMRRYPLSPPDGVYSYNLRGGQNTSWPQTEEGESALSRSMRYADPWLYGSVRGGPPGTFVLAPAFILCSCPDYLNGTKKSASKKGPTVCKKCKGTRVSLTTSNGDNKFGTVRCKPSSSTPSAVLQSASTTTQVRAGTVRVTSSSTRSSILPTNKDPYDLMRRSRLNANSEANSPFRGRSLSPKKRTTPTSSKTTGRRSILECDINPYELMSTDDNQPTKDSSITFVNGQRIRVLPPAPEPDYEDVVENLANETSSTPSAISRLKPNRAAPEPPPLSPSSINEDRSNNFKSILKKSTNFGENTTTVDIDRPRNGPNFYLPMPSTPRKKVQFLEEDVEGEFNIPITENEEPIIQPDVFEEKKTPSILEGRNNRNHNLRRSTSERFKIESQKVVFLDTMALRMKPSRSDSREIFNRCDLEKLDGLIQKRKISPRPKDPPPSPPVKKTEKSPETEAVVTEDMEDSLEKEAKSLLLMEELTRRISQSSIKLDQDIPESTNDIKDAPVSTNAAVDADIIEVEMRPKVPPRKKISNKSNQVHVVESPDLNIEATVEAPPETTDDPNENSSPVESLNEEKQTLTEIKSDDYNKRTIVQITPSSPVHRIQIKNEFHETSNVQSISIPDTTQRKTSILINGDDCYSTINVNDDIPLYQSSVVVKDCGITEAVPSFSRRSSSVYITGSTSSDEKENADAAKEENNENTVEQPRTSTPDMLRELLRDPVEAVKRNLVPHICGKSDVSRRPRDSKLKNYYPMVALRECHSSTPDSKENSSKTSLRVCHFDSLIEDDKDSEHSLSTQYEFVDPGSDCYTDHSNRSSVTEEELANRTKFYELLADSTLLEVSENEDHHYECINRNEPDPIYEEIEIPPPLPTNPPPANLLDDLKLDKEFTTRSIFEGASKYDILSYLVDAKERGIVPEDSYTFSSINGDDFKERGSKICHMSDSSDENSLVLAGALIDDKTSPPKCSDIERNDSGVGSETSKSSLSKYRTKQVTSASCEDCETSLDALGEDEPMLCRKCVKKRSERKEIIMEIVETEEKYSKDLQIVLEEFYQPMLVAGLLTPEQLSTIFLNVEELLENSQSLAERLRDAVEIATEQGDEDLLTVNMGKLFLEAAPMLHAFETYCVRQGPASLLLASLEKEKELLRIFLRVSQMENTLLRRMNLNSFLMVPVQRVTKYPLLLARLYKVTPNNNEVREQLREAQHKIELHLNHMNSQTKDVPSKLWRRIGSSSGRRSSTEMDLVNIKLRKIAVDVLEWNHDEAKFALEGKLWFTQPTDNNWRKGRTIKLSPVNALLVINGKPNNTSKSERDEHSLIFPKHSPTREAALLLVRDKNGRYSLLRDPLYLDRCLIASDPAWQSYFEVQELLGKDTFIFKAEDEDQTRMWYQQLQFHAQGMGAWRKRRNALANIMMNGMGLRL